MEPEGLVRVPVRPGAPRLGALWLRTTPGWAMRAVLRSIHGRPAGSALRTRVLNDGVRIALALSNKGKDDLLLRGYFDPEIEMQIDADERPLDVAAAYRGFDGYRALREAYAAAGASEFTAHELLDLGGPFYAHLLSATFTGGFSGAPVLVRFALVASARDGLLIRQRVVWSWDAAPAALADAVRAG